MTLEAYAGGYKFEASLGYTEILYKKRDLSWLKRE
jgi:hypothetical protein